METCSLSKNLKNDRRTKSVISTCSVHHPYENKMINNFKPTFWPIYKTIKPQCLYVNDALMTLSILCRK